MSDKKMTRSQAVEQVLAEVDGPMPVDEFCERVLEIFGSTAKDPVSAMRSHLREQHNGRTLIFLDAKTILPMSQAMHGVRFRITLDRREADRGVLIIQPAFEVFLRRGVDPGAVQLLDQRGQPLSTRVVTLRAQVSGPFGNQSLQIGAFALQTWFRERRVRRNDSLLVTIEDWTAGRFRLEHEPAKRRHRAEIERQDQELADLLFDMLEASRSQTIYAHEAIPTAYARLADPRGYPGHHWIEVLHDDPRMRYDGFAIRYGDWRSPLERMFQYEEEPAPQADVSAAQARHVYRFKAALWHHRSLWRRLEIQGRQTLAELDAILRTAFEHDPFDHMAGFWQRVRRGKGKRFREVDVGSVDPLGGGDGADVQIAGLELEPGDELKYVYDFGDWIEHHLTLEAIDEPEKGATYPRIVAQNKPRYKKCGSCQARGRDTRATWICLQCSNEQQREVLLCKECLAREHEDHYADEILY